MTTRYEAERAALVLRPPKLATALRGALASYTRADLRADAMAGLVVGVVALPLSMALGIASGAPPQHGIYTAIVAGLLTALLGGSKVQVSGPTAAFVVLLAPVSAHHGLRGLLVASLMAGVLLVLMGFARLGTLIQFVPYPVTIGFTAGIAIVIATLQVRDFLGLSVAVMPSHYIERVIALARALPTTRWSEVLVGGATLGALIVWPRLRSKIPGHLPALLLGTVLALVLTQLGAPVDTIRGRFSYMVGGVAHGGIPQLPPIPMWPWSGGGVEHTGLVPFSVSSLRELAISAMAIAMLGAIESLLSAVVADGMTGGKHDPDAEVTALGIANIVAPFFGGFAATGAIARTATNIRAGARSPIAAVIHSLFLLAAVVVLAPLLGYLPMASLAALLIMTAWNMSEVKHVFRTMRIAPRSDVFVLITCISLTVIFDMVVSVTVGVMLAAMLFMRRMIDVSGTKMIAQGDPSLRQPLPPGVVLYEIAGPLFFGAAHRAMSSLNTVSKGIKTVILDLENVLAIDATGLVNMESAMSRLHSMHVDIVLVGLRPQPLKAMTRAGLVDAPHVALAPSIDEAVATVAHRAHG